MTSENPRTLPLLEETQRRPGGYSLRVSVLDQCDLRCGYCQPGSVQGHTARKRWLRPVDYARLAPLFFERGVRKVRFTGGEPLLREDLPEVVRAFHDAKPEAELALTTNGTRLAERASELAGAGLKKLTVHLDTLRPDRYRALMRAPEGATPQALLRTMERARVYFPSLKINCVVQRGENDDELRDFLDMSRDTGIEVRFIEQMNTGSAEGYVQRTFVSGGEILARIEENSAASLRPRRHEGDPATLHHDARADVVFGIIASDTQPFCDACDRLRLTADGRLRGCLYESGGIPLGDVLAADAAARQVEALIDVALADKRSHHPLVAPDRAPFSMADVGG
jgi:cyclic pyranopterin phosphate synthase